MRLMLRLVLLMELLKHSGSATQTCPKCKCQDYNIDKDILYCHKCGTKYSLFKIASGEQFLNAKED